MRVDVPLVRRMLAEQCPHIEGFGPTADLSLEVVTEGWDNVMLRLGPSLAVRVPRRSLSARLIVHEQQWLGSIAARVDVLVPAPVVAGTPTAEYPWHWTVVPWVDGRAAGSVDRARLRGVAEPLAAFFTELRTPAPSDAPINVVRGGPLAGRDAAVRERLTAIRHPRGDELATAWETALAAPRWSGPAAWLHGDPHPYNVVVSDEPSGDVALQAVVDFGDMTSGDPACDLAAAWLVFDRTGRAAFRAAVDAHRLDAPPVHAAALRDVPAQLRAPGSPGAPLALDAPVRLDAAVWDRARGWALVLATALLAHSDDAPELAAAGAQTVEAVLDDV